MHSFYHSGWITSRTLLGYFLLAANIAVEKWLLDSYNLLEINFVTAALFMIVVSLLTRPKAGIAAYVWTPTLNRPTTAQRERHPWYQRVGFWTIVAGVMYVTIYAIFW